MKILKRTQGIDLKAKNSSIRGDVCLQLRDAVTGKVTFEERGHNMLTNGLNSALNGCPFGLNKVDTAYTNTQGTNNNFQVTPIFKQLLGGVILFPQTLGNDADLLFPSFANSPTGFSSMASYSQEDGRQGTFDSVSSGKITNGYKYVHSWGSAYGNGQIASLGLAPINAHTWCYNAENAFKPTTNLDTYRTIGYYYNIQRQQTTINAIGDKGILISSLATTSATKLSYFKTKPFAVDLFQDTAPATSTTGLNDESNAEWTVDTGVNLSANQPTQVQIDDTNAYVISRNNNTFTVITIALASGTMTSNTYTFAGASFGSSKPAMVNGYIYQAASTAGTIYKCNMSNVADISEITDASIKANDRLMYCGENYIYGKFFLLDVRTDDIVAFTNQYGFMTDEFWRSVPCYEKGMWTIVRSSQSAETAICAVMKQWGLMTHFDLQSAVTKDASKQMVVQYSITQA